MAEKPNTNEYAARAEYAEKAGDAETLGGHPASYFAPMRIGTSTVSFTDAWNKAGGSYPYDAQAIEKFASAIVPTLSSEQTNTTVVVVQNGPHYAIWYYLLNQQFYTGVLIDYSTNIRTLRFSRSGNNYIVREI